MPSDTPDPTRREFIGAAVATGVALSGLAAEPEPLPHVTICGHTIPRMILGCNQMNGCSHMCRNMSQAMTDWFTAERITSYLQDCGRYGLDVWLTFTDPRAVTAMRAMQDHGTPIRPFFLAALNADGALSRDLLQYQPLWLVHHGNLTDDLFRAGQQQKVHDFVKKVHDELGIPAGISAHNPDCIKYAEDHGWEADLYQCCLYYLTRPHQELRAKLGGAPLGESFLDTDRDHMLSVIRQVNKPCLAFKILAAGRLCDSDAQIEEAFQHTLTGIKPGDAIIVGMWPKFKDELSQNVALLRKHGRTG